MVRPGVNVRQQQPQLLAEAPQFCKVGTDHAHLDRCIKRGPLLKGQGQHLRVRQCLAQARLQIGQ